MFAGYWILLKLIMYRCFEINKIVGIYTLNILIVYDYVIAFDAFMVYV